MPTLKLLGRKWHMASDDLPLPSLLGASWHFAISVLNAVDLAYVVNSLKPSCKYRTEHIGYLSSHLSCFVINTILHTWTYFESRRGSIFQVHRRRRVGPLGVAVLLFYALTIANNVYGTRLVKSYSDQEHEPCRVESPPLELNHGKLMKAIVISTWVSLLVGFIAMLITFNLFSTYKAARSSWVSRCKCCSYACFCCCIGALSKDYNGRGDSDSDIDGGRQQSIMSPTMVIASVFTLIFGKVDMTLSDYLAAFTLLGAQHRYRKPALLYGNAPPPKWLGRSQSGQPWGGAALEATLQPPTVLELEASGRSPPSVGAAAAGSIDKRPRPNTGTGNSLASSPTPSITDQAAPLEPYPANAAPPTTSATAPTTAITASAPQAAVADAAAARRQPQQMESATPNSPNCDDARFSAGSKNRVAPDDVRTRSPSGGQTPQDVGLAEPPSEPAAEPPSEPAAEPPSEPAAEPPLNSPYGHSASPATWDGNYAEANVSLEVMEEAVHYLKFATAVYGWKMYLWMNRTQVSQCCQLCVGRRCGCCRQSAYFCPVGRGDKGPPEAVFLPNRLLEREAITQITGVADEDILYVSYANKIGGLLPYYIALDRAHESVVIAIRGSLSLRDVVTDLLCEPAEFEVPGVPSRDAEGHRVLWAHRGMLKATLAILKDIQEKGILEAAIGGPKAAEGDGMASKRAKSAAHRLRSSCTGWRVVVTGHSLGGGVTGLLGPLLRSQYPNIRCWAFAPPGGLMSPKAAELTREYCIGVVHAKDMIPRLAVTTMELLVQSLVKACVHCKVNKATVMWNIIMLGQRPGNEALFKPDDQLTRELQDVLVSHDSSVEGIARCRVSARFNNARGFVPPGHLLYVERRKLEAEEQPCCSCNVCMVDKSHTVCGFACRWIQVQDLMREGLVVSRSMFMDHLPDNTFNAMQAAVKQLQLQRQLDPGLSKSHPSSSPPTQHNSQPPIEPTHISITVPSMSSAPAKERLGSDARPSAGEMELCGCTVDGEAGTNGAEAVGSSPGSRAEAVGSDAV